MVSPMAFDPETAAMVDDLIGRCTLATVAALNAVAQEIFDQSQIEVPKSQDHQLRPNDPGYPMEPLQQTGGINEATPENLTVEIYYDSPYATAQEVGMMEYTSRGGKPVEWEVENYTTMGTKAHYLEDPLKAALGKLAPELEFTASLALGETELRTVVP